MPPPQQLAHASVATVATPETCDAASARDEVQTDDELDSPVDQQQQQPQQLQQRRVRGSLDLDWESGHSGAGDASGNSSWMSRIPLVVPVLAAATAVLLLVRAVTRGGRGRRTSTSGACSSESGAPRRPKQQRKSASGAAAAPKAVAEAALREQSEPAPSLEVYASPFAEAPEASPGGTTWQPLHGLRLAVSEHIAVKGAPTGCGVPALMPYRAPAAASAAPLLSLQAAGARVACHCSTQPLNTPNAGDNIRNPAGAWRISGGGATGAAAAVAQGESDVGLGTELLGNLHMPAACMSLCSYMPTPGALGDWENGAATGSAPACHERIGLVSQDMAPLMAIADVLKLPGNPNLRHELTQVVVAEDLFKLCDPDMAPAIVAIKKAVLHWAGQEQAGSVQLLSFLEGNVSRWKELLHDADAHGDQYTGPEGAGQTSPVLRALHRAADILQKRDVWRRYGGLLGQHKEQQQQQQEQQEQQQQQEQQEQQEQQVQQHEEHVETPGHDGDDDQQQQEHRLQSALAGQLDGKGGSGGSSEPRLLPSDVVQLLEEAACVTDAQVEAAQAVADEVEDIIRGAVRRDVVVVAPIVPCPPPRLDAPAAVITSFVRRSRQFACIMSLAGAPTVTLPLGGLVGSGAGEGAPVGLALFGQARSDQRLLAIASKLLPLAQAELKQQQQQPQVSATSAPSGPSTPRSAARRSGITPAPSTKRTAGAGARGAAGPARPGAKRSAGAAGGQGSSGGGAGASAAAAAAAGAAQEALDPKKLERAEKAKARGNDLFRKGEYIEAVKCYTEALRQVPDNAVYYSNRAMAYLKAFRFEQAETDCNRALGFDLSSADRVKALLRRGTARQHLYRVAEAAEDFRAVLRVEPNNRQAREELRAIKQQEEEMASAQRTALMQQRNATTNGGVPGGFGGLPHGMGLGGGEDGEELANGDGDEEPFLNAEEYQRLLASGQVPVLLGEDGRPVYGPRGEPVVLAPDGQPLLIGADGEVMNYHR